MLAFLKMSDLHVPREYKVRVALDNLHFRARTKSATSLAVQNRLGGIWA